MSEEVDDAADIPSGVDAAAAVANDNDDSHTAVAIGAVGVNDEACEDGEVMIASEIPGGVDAAAAEEVDDGE